jgi:hypothetical protein
MLNGNKMKKNKDPITLLSEQISSIENKYNTATKKIDEEDLIVVLLTAVPFEYQAILTCEQQRLKGTNLKLSDLEVVMNQYWRQTETNASLLSCPFPYLSCAASA